MSDIFYFNIKDLATASKKDEIDAGFIIVVMRNHLEAIRRETDERHDHQTKKRETEKRPRE